MKNKFATCGTTNCACDRCGEPCRVAERRNPDSKPFRLSAKPKGVCANCVMTQFLYNTYPVNMQIDEAGGPELLLKPAIRAHFRASHAIRAAFRASGLLAGCDLNIDEVNWIKVVVNWHLPVKVVKSATNPYRMGESPKSYLHREPKQPENEEQRAFVEKWNPILDEHRGVLRGELGEQFLKESGLRDALDKANGRVQ